MDTQLKQYIEDIKFNELLKRMILKNTALINKLRSSKINTKHRII